MSSVGAIQRLDANGTTIDVVATQVDGRWLTYPNDVALDTARGTFYITDSGYKQTPAQPPPDPQGRVYRVDRDDRVREVAAGIALGAPERTVVAFSGDGAFCMNPGMLLVERQLALPNLKLLVTAGTALVSVAAYSIFFGWEFAAGFVVLLFVHEMGHVIALRREGMDEIIVVPLLLALMLSALLVPMVDWLDRRGAPRADMAWNHLLRTYWSCAVESGPPRCARYSQPSRRRLPCR